MGDQNHGFAIALLSQGAENDCLVQAVQVGGWLVQQQEGRIVEERSGQTQPLPLSAGQAVAQLGNLRIIALGQACDKIMDGGLFAGHDNLLVGGIQLGQAQIIADGIVEQVGILGHKAFHSTEVIGVNFLHASAGDGNHALPDLPEAHKELQKRGLSGTGTAADADNLPLRAGDGEILQYGFPTVGEGHIFRRGTVEGNLLLAADFRGHRGFIQDVQHPIARGKGILQRRAQSGKGDHGAEGAHHGKGCDEAALKAHKQGRGKQHCQVKQQNYQARGRAVSAGGPLHLFLRLCQAVGLGIHLLQPLLAPAILDGFRKAPQAVQDKGGQLPRFSPEAGTQIPAAPGGHQGDDGPHREIGRQSQRAQRWVNSSDEHHQNAAEQDRNADGGNGMGIEHFQKLNVGGDDGNQVPLVLPFQLGRAQSAQSAKYPVPNQGQQLKGNVVVAGLLRIAKEPPHQGEDQHRPKNQPQTAGPLRMQNKEHPVAAENRNKRGTQVAQKAHGNGQNHIAAQWLYQAHQPGHNVQSASLHVIAPPR